MKPRLIILGNLTRRSLGLGALAILVAACAATSVKQTWKAPDFQGPVGKVGVLTMVGRVGLREGFENRVAGQLEKGGTTAMTTFDLLSLARIKEDKAAAAARFEAGGAQSLLILRLVDKTSSYREIRPGGERWAPVVGGVDPMGWYGYYTAAFMDMSPTYGSLREVAYIETVLYDLKSEKRLWSGLTETVVKDTTDRPAEVDRLVAKIVGAMRRDGVVP